MSKCQKWDTAVNIILSFNHHFNYIIDINIGSQIKTSGQTQLKPKLKPKIHIFAVSSLAVLQCSDSEQLTA